MYTYRCPEQPLRDHLQDEGENGKSAGDIDWGFVPSLSNWLALPYSSEITTRPRQWPVRILHINIGQLRVPAPADWSQILCPNARLP